MKEKFMNFVVGNKKELIKVGSAVLGAAVGVAIVTFIDNQQLGEIPVEDVFVE